MNKEKLLEFINRQREEHAFPKDDYGLGYFKALDDFESKIQSEPEEISITLPCNIGDAVYGILINKIKEYRVFAINIGVRESNGSCVVLAKNDRNASISFELIDFGKSVFLTREEALKAIEKAGE